MLRRRLSLRYPDQVSRLTTLLVGSEPPRAVAVRDPERLAEAALYHRVVGYVVAAAQRGHLRLPERVVSRLEFAYRAEALHAQLLRRELGLVGPPIARACGARPVLLKGPAVSDRFYADPRLRPFRDLDLLVPVGALDPAIDALAAAGYRPEAEPWAGYGRRHGHHVAMTRRMGKRALTCEMHWRISDDPAGERLDHARLDRTAVSMDVEDFAVAVPAPAEQLLVLALHLLHEPAKRLAWVHDLALVADSLADPDWDRAFAVASETELQWVLHRALDYVGRHLGLDRTRPAGPVPRPAWGPLRAGEALTGWVGFQAGRLGVGGWRAPEGYLLSAARARWRAMRTRTPRG